MFPQTPNPCAQLSAYLLHLSEFTSSAQKMLFAVLDRPKEALQALLDHGASANAVGVDVMAVDPRASTQPVEGSILHAAARRGRVDLVQILLSNGANAQSKDQTGFSALHYAAQMGHKDSAVALLRSGADVNALSPEHWTPLHAAAHSGFSEVVRLLLENGADPLRKTASGQLPAAVTSSSAVLGLLPTAASSSAIAVSSPRTALSTSGSLSVSASPASTPRTPTGASSASHLGSSPISGGAVNPNYQASQPVSMAGKSASAAMGSGSSSSTSPPSTLAVSPPLSGVVSPRKAGAAPLSGSPNRVDADAPVSSLWVAAAAGHISAVTESLGHGDVDLNLVHLDGSTPLWIACSRGHPEVVRLLCGHKDIDVEVVHKKLGTTPLFAACASGHTEVAKILLEKGAHVHTEDKQGDTVLHVSAMNGNLEIVQLMLANSNFILSVAVNEQNDEGATSLFLAAANGHDKVVQALLAAAASADIRNMSGLTPLDVAIKNNHPTVWRLLTTHLKEQIARERAELDVEQKALNDLLERARPLQADSVVLVNVKCLYNNKIRSTSIANNASMEEIASGVKSLFDIPTTRNVELKYVDADKDKLSLSDMDDLRDFFMFCPSKTIEIT